jgi:hypothetical protein
VNAKRNPWEAGDDVVFPSADPFPVTPQHLHGRFTPAVHNFTSATGSYWAFRVRPDVLGFVVHSTPGAADPEDVTCSGGIANNTVGYAGILANFGFYRSVGLGLRIIGLQQLLEAGGSMVISRLPPYTPTAVTLQEIWESALTDVVSAGALAEESKGEFIRWIAATEQASLFIPGPTAYPTASGFRGPSVNSVDSDIWVCMYCEATTTDLTCEVEYDFLINSIPLVSSNQLFDVKAVPSSPDALAKADLAASMQDAGGSGGKEGGSGLIGVADKVGHEALGVARSGLGELAKELGPFGQIAESLGSTAIDFLGGLFAVNPDHHVHLMRLHATHNQGDGFLSDNMRVLGPSRLIAMHQLAVFSGLPDFSPLCSPLPPHVVTIGEFLKFLALHSGEVRTDLLEETVPLRSRPRRRMLPAVAVRQDDDFCQVASPPGGLRTARDGRSAG